jgi:hypothetical protein
VTSVAIAITAISPNDADDLGVKWLVEADVVVQDEKFRAVWEVDFGYQEDMLTLYQDGEELQDEPVWAQKVKLHMEGAVQHIFAAQQRAYVQAQEEILKGWGRVSVEVRA